MIDDENLVAPTNVSGVTASMTARHTDPYMDEGTHQHTWNVTAFYPAEPFQIGRAHV